MTAPTRWSRTTTTAASSSSRGYAASAFPVLSRKGILRFPLDPLHGMTSEEFAERLLKEEKVAVVHGSAFRPAGRRLCSLLLRYFAGGHRGSPDADEEVCRKIPEGLAAEGGYYR